MWLLVIDGISSIAREGTWFNSVEFIKIIEKFWLLIFPTSLIIPKIRKFVHRCLKAGYNFGNENLFCKLPFMKTIIALQQDFMFWNIERMKMHKEQMDYLKVLNTTVTGLAQSIVATSLRIESIEKKVNICKGFLNANFEMVDSTEAFREALNKDESELLRNGYMNSIHFDDRKIFREQLEVIKKEGRPSTFEIKILQTDFTYQKYLVKLTPDICVKDLFFGCEIELYKI